MAGSEQGSGELNEPQLRAVVHPRGPLLVFAGAGSGKTRVITYRIAHLLTEHRIPPYRILSVTFTNKAAREMTRRLTALAGDAITQDLAVGTFHATCARLLRRYAPEVGLEKNYVIYDESDQRALLSRVLKDLGFDEKAMPAKRVLQLIHQHKREGLGPGEVNLDYRTDETFVEIYTKYEQALRHANAVDFEDLIVHVMRIAESNTTAGQELRSRYDDVLVDEFQDTNLTQYRLVRALTQEQRSLCVVGDDDQSIYSWRGADIRNIRGFQADFPECAVVKLEQNYRSSANIVQAALGVIEPAASREPKQLWTEQPEGELVIIRRAPDERGEAEQVVTEIRRCLARGVPADEIAVFYRINAQSRVLEEALRRANMAYQVVGGMKFFERAEVKHLLAYLRLLVNPESDADLLRIINVPTRGIGNKTVQQLLTHSARYGTSLYGAISALLHDRETSSASKKKLAAFHQLIERLRECARSEHPSAVAERVLDWSGYRELLIKEDSAESDARLENLRELVGAVLEYEREVTSRQQQPSLEEYLERVSLVSDVDQMRDQPCVVLMTVHSAKGLEFDSVFLTGMEDEVFPYRGLDGEHAEEFEEERRLCYVAITRARRRLWISFASMRTLFGQTRYLAPSQFLASLPSSVVRFEGGSSSPRLAPKQPAAARARFAIDASERVIDYTAFGDISAEDDEPVAAQLRAGSLVRHQRFGQGRVEQVVEGDIPIVVARFPGFGTRKILAKFLQLG